MIPLSAFSEEVQRSVLDQIEEYECPNCGNDESFHVFLKEKDDDNG